MSGRNIIICCDGTNNEFGEQNTNIVRLIQCLDRKPGLQRLYYDPGVGTLPEPGVITGIGKWISKAVQLGFGVGLESNVKEAYSFLMDQWETGDKVYMFGFSRGAYTVRVLAGLLHSVGLLPRGNYNLIPYVFRIYKSIQKRGLTREQTVEKYKKLCGEFRETFCIETGDPERRFPTHFMGIWDTVSSVGWVWNPTSYPFATNNPSVRTVRHAMAIDERRAFFRQNLMNKQHEDHDIEQIWFPGVHADVGGGYLLAESDLWKPSFGWIATEAKKSGLDIEEDLVKKFLGDVPVELPPWPEQIHESLTKKWWIAEIIPKHHVRGFMRLRSNLFRSRSISKGAAIHQTAFRKDYRPRNLPHDFLHSTKVPPGEDTVELK
jgi:uncharacterized protein (DUF2235 family)